VIHVRDDGNVPYVRALHADKSLPKKQEPGAMAGHDEDTYYRRRGRLSHRHELDDEARRARS